MFKTNDNEDRVSYSSMLIPPEGYVLERAIGTTYSLDLEALTAVTIALGLQEELDPSLLSNPLNMLHALYKVSDKILLFCEAGQIAEARRNTELYKLFILLEKIVIPVALPKKAKGNYYPAFHPKTWLLQYVNGEGKRFYRFAILSRNLTFNRNWDISVCLEGTEGTGHCDKTKPIIAFLGFLRNQVDAAFTDSKKKRSMIKSLMADLEDISFTTNTPEFGEDFTIMPLGIGSGSYDKREDPLISRGKKRESDRFDKLVVISPFLSANVVKYWNRPECNPSYTARTLITTQMALEKLKPENYNRFKAYVLKDNILDGEEDIYKDEDEIQRQDIHAKMYLYQMNKEVFLYMGSMNATMAAMDANVEMLIRLRTEPRHLTADQLLNDLFGDDPDGKWNPFEEPRVYEEESEEKNPIDILENKIKEICRIKISVEVIPVQDKFDLRITAEIPEGSDCSGIQIAPISKNVWEPLDKEIIFRELDVVNLSEFYRIQVTAGDSSITRIIMIPTTGFPENREKTFVNSIVDNSANFTNYVALLLSDNYVATMIEGQEQKNTGTGGKTHERMPSLYEKMLKTALLEPERIEEIEFLIKMVDNKEIIPDEFRDIYKKFKTVLKLK